MAGKMNYLFGFLLVGIALIHGATAQIDHAVGGTAQWSTPSSPTFYSTWAATQKFTVGDTITFTFDSTHDVGEVTKAGYDACDSSTTIGTSNPNSPVTKTLSSPGLKYYICSFHCQSGQKLAITVLAAAASPPPTTTTSPPPAIATPPPTSAPPPTSSTVPPPSSDSPPSASSPPPSADAPPPVTSTVPPPSPSSSQFVAAAFSVTFWSIAVALFC